MQIQQVYLGNILLNISALCSLKLQGRLPGLWQVAHTAHRALLWRLSARVQISCKTLYKLQLILVYYVCASRSVRGRHAGSEVPQSSHKALLWMLTWTPQDQPRRALRLLRAQYLNPSLIALFMTA